MVEQLTQSGISFTFKGGTSLLLILQEPKRFSIDVDIVTRENKDKIEDVLAMISTQGVFSKFELDAARSYKPGIPKAHYLLTFFSQWDKKEKHILLDVLYEEHGYAALIDAPIINEWIKTDENIITTKIPSAESITGDKLTAFAPNTVGIRYKVQHENGGVTEKQMEVMKQLFDLGILFDRLTNVAHFKHSFNNIATKEIGYRPQDQITITDILNDTINTSLMIATGGKLSDPNRDFNYISTGITQLKSFIYKDNFRIDEAIVSSAKAAYLSAIVLSDYNEEILKWNAKMDIMEYMIESTHYNILNKKRNVPGGALFYWYHTLKLKGSI